MTESHSVRAYRERCRLREVIAVLVLSIALWCWWSWPLIGTMNSAMFGLPGDSTGSIYDFWHARNFGFSVLPSSRNSLLAYPTGLPNGGVLLLPGIALFVPGVILTLLSNEVVAYNILILCGFSGTAVASYWFFRTALTTRFAAATMTTAFTLLPYHQLSLLQWYGQGQLAGIPITAYFCLKMHRNLRSSSVAAVVVSIVISFALNAYVGLMSAVIALAGFSLTLVEYRHLVRASLRRVKARTVVFGVVSVLTVASVLTVLSQLVGDAARRSGEELHVYGLRPRELLQPTPFSSVSPFRTAVPPMRDLHGSNLVEVSQYVGISVVLLAAVSAWWAIRRRKTSWSTSFGLVVVCLGLIFGVSQGITLGSIHLPSPAEVISFAAPFWRVYSRFGLLIGFGCLLLVGQLFDLMSSVWRHRYLARVICASLALIIFADLWIASPGKHIQFDEPSYVQYLSENSRGVMMEYPLAGSNDYLRYQRRFTQRELKNPTLNGSYETDNRLIRLKADNLESPGIESVLQALGVQWVIVQDSEYVASGVPVPKLDATFGILRFNADGVRVFEIPRQTATGVAWVDEGGFPVESNGVSNGQWINKTARIVVARKDGGCARLVMSVGLYPGVQELRVRQVGQDEIVSKGGVIDLKLASFTDTTQVTVSSIQDPVQIPGPDPRSVSAWINSEMRVVPSPCP